MVAGVDEGFGKIIDLLRKTFLNPIMIKGGGCMYGFVLTKNGLNLNALTFSLFQFQN